MVVFDDNPQIRRIPLLDFRQGLRPELFLARISAESRQRLGAWDIQALQKGALALLFERFRKHPRHRRQLPRPALERGEGKGARRPRRSGGEHAARKPLRADVADSSVRPARRQIQPADAQKFRRPARLRPKARHGRHRHLRRRLRLRDALRELVLRQERARQDARRILLVSGRRARVQRPRKIRRQQVRLQQGDRDVGALLRNRRFRPCQARRARRVADRRHLRRARRRRHGKAPDNADRRHLGRARIPVGRRRMRVPRLRARGIKRLFAGRVGALRILFQTLQKTRRRDLRKSGSRRALRPIVLAHQKLDVGGADDGFPRGADGRLRQSRRARRGKRSRRRNIRLRKAFQDCRSRP